MKTTVELIFKAFLILWLFIGWLYILGIVKPSKNKKQRRLRSKVTRINRKLLEAGMNYNEILQFWNECFAEAEIQNNLSPCVCGNVNQCETWCRVKARFAMNPPE